jgi:hypothetical protein
MRNETCVLEDDHEDLVIRADAFLGPEGRLRRARRGMRTCARLETKPPDLTAAVVTPAWAHSVATR